MSEVSGDIASQYADLVSERFDFSKMDPAHRAFAIEYVMNGYNYRKAAKTCRMDPSRGVRLKRIPIVVAFITELQKRDIVESFVGKQSLDCFLDRIEEAAMGDVDIPIVLADGTSIDRPKFQGSLAMDVYRERAKLHGILVQEETPDNTIRIEVVPSTRDSEGEPL